MATPMYSDVQVVPHPDQDPLVFEIARLIDDLKHEELAVRTTSVQSLPKILEALGEERSRDELLPFLAETLLDDEDELLEEVAEIFPKLVKGLGGVKYIHLLLNPLEELISVEEPSVRAKAADSFGQLLAQMKPDEINTHFLPVMRRLCDKDWFTARSAVSALFIHVYPKSNKAVQKELRGRFGQLCQDLTPTVRKSAAASLGKFAQVIDAKIVKDEIKPLFDTLAKDAVDSVRIQTFQNVVDLANLSQDKEYTSKILETVYDLANDAAWRVRWTIANGFVHLAELLSKQQLHDAIPTFLTIYTNLMKDAEPEVRAAAVRDLNRVAELFYVDKSNDDVPTALIPVIQVLVHDEMYFVRSAAALVICRFAAIIGEEKTLDLLLDPFLALLKDPEAEVRMNFIKNLESLDEVHNIQDLSGSLLTSINELALDTQWRVRYDIILEIPSLAKLLGRQIFDNTLASSCMEWLEDEVSKIRHAATKNLPEMVRLFGDDWVNENIRPKLESLVTNNSYLFRMQSLRAIAALAPVLSEEMLNNTMVPFILELVKDPTANIKFNVAKCVAEDEVLAKLTQPVLQEKILPAIKELLDPSKYTTENPIDMDVEYYGTIALDKINAKLAV